MENNLRKISIDLGNGYVKVAFHGKVFMFRSAFKTGIREDESSEGFDVRFNGVDYTVGAGNTSSTLIGEKISDVSTLLYIANALNIAYSTTNYIDNVELTLGLPAAYTATYRDSLKTFILENLKDQVVSFGGIRKTISVVDVKVAMQGAIFATDLNAFKNKKTLVIDVGAGTIDCLLFNNFKLAGDPLTLEKGMQKYWETLMININKSSNPILSTMTKFRDYKDVENCVINNDFVVNRKSYSINEKDSPFTDIVNETLKNYFNQDIETIRGTFGVDTLHNVILTGGAASFLKPFFETKLGPCSLVNLGISVSDLSGKELSENELQQYINVINYYRLSTMSK